MKQTIIKSEERGKVDFGWLKSFHSFSFGHYYNPSKMHFGALRVLNDDTVAPGMGFDTHPHKNMEIISIPLEGELAHRDSMGNTQLIKKGDIQVMSAGTGIQHSEYNNDKNNEVKFLQIWIIPKNENVIPRYDQISIGDSAKNTLRLIVSPNPEDEGVWIHQNAWFYLGKYEEKQNIEYKLKSTENGIYLFLISGSIIINNQTLYTRDSISIENIESMHFETAEQSEFLIIEVPMNI